MSNDATFLSLLTHTALVKRRSSSVSSIDDWGIPEETITTGTTTLNCLIQPLNEAIEFDVRGKKEMATKMGFFKISDSILQDDIIIFKNKQYIVIGVEDAAGQSHHQEVFLRRMENEN